MKCKLTHTHNALLKQSCWIKGLPWDYLKLELFRLDSEEIGMNFNLIQVKLKEIVEMLTIEKC